MDIQTLLDHYVKLAKEPAFKAYAWKRVLELSETLPEWRELPELLKEAMKHESSKDR